MDERKKRKEWKEIKKKNSGKGEYKTAIRANKD
jgi:hypothetical protein